MHHKKQQGFSIVSAVFILIVLSLLSAFMVNIAGVQRATGTLALNGARVFYAAKSGIEWGSYNAMSINPKTNFNQTFNITAGDGFNSNVSVSGIYTSTTESGTTIDIYTITSTASFGSSGTLDYVSRQIIATVSTTPP